MLIFVFLDYPPVAYHGRTLFACRSSVFSMHVGNLPSPTLDISGLTVPLQLPTIHLDALDHSTHPFAPDSFVSNSQDFSYSAGVC